MTMACQVFQDLKILIICPKYSPNIPEQHITYSLKKGRSAILQGIIGFNFRSNQTLHQIIIARSHQRGMNYKGSHSYSKLSLGVFPIYCSHLLPSRHLLWSFGWMYNEVSSVNPLGLATGPVTPAPASGPWPLSPQLRPNLDLL